LHIKHQNQLSVVKPFISCMKRTLVLWFVVMCFFSARAQHNFSVIAYYAGGPETVDSIPAEKLTHIIFSFCHLKGNQLSVDSGRDSLTIQKLVGLKSRNSKLKIILSLGGWGGCPSCSDVFSTAKGREEFAQSTLALNQHFHSDGIDLDWEYPTIRTMVVAKDFATFLQMIVKTGT